MVAAPGGVTQTWSCAPNPNSCTISLEDVKQMWLQLATLEEAVSKPPPAAGSFFLQTNLGVFLWNNLVWIFLGCFLSKLLDIFRSAKAVQEICNYICRKGLQRHGTDPISVDICEGAMALASPGVTEATAADIKGRENEISLRKKLRWIWCKSDLSGKRSTTEDHDTLPVTNCQALPIASQASSNCSMSQITTSSMPSSALDTVNVPLSVSMFMPNYTALTAEDAKDLQAQAANYLPSHTEDYTIEGGSTFLSATVWIAPSAMDDLIHRAVCLLKMGCVRDTACTVQLGNTAILYNTTTADGKRVACLEMVTDECWRALIIPTKSYNEGFK